VIARIRAGGAPAEADVVIAAGEIGWTKLPVKDMVEAVWRWFYKKNVYDSVGETQKTYADDGSTVNSTASATLAAGVEVRGHAA